MNANDHLPASGVDPVRGGDEAPSRRRDGSPLAVSVLMPGADDAGRLAMQLRLLAGLRGSAELLVSTALPPAHVPRLAASAASRIMQLDGPVYTRVNALATQARGEFLLLIRPGIVLPIGIGALVTTTLDECACEWGWLDLRYGKGRFRRLRSLWRRLGAHSRCRLDDAHPIFVRRSLFAAMGGLPPIACGSHRALGRSLRAAGYPAARCARPVLVSGG